VELARSVQVLNGAAATFSRNVQYAGGSSAVSSSVSSDPLELRRTNPAFVNPLPVDPTADQQQRTALVPWAGEDLVPQSTSPLVDSGVDRRTVAGVTSALGTGMDRCLTTDVRGTSRPPGGSWDIGAYELGG
jgi:hypothetical protein